jgi:Transposase DDE domain group 1
VKDKHRRPWLSVMVGSESLVSQAGGSLLVATARATGLSRELSAGLRRWRRPWAVHDPGKIVLDLAVAVALGGDCAADIAVLRAQPGVFGRVASDPTVSRVVARLAQDVDAALGAIAAARALARQWVWGRAGVPVQDGKVVIDLDATLVTAHSDKESATCTWKKTFGFHPLLAYADHGAGGTGEPLAGLLRPGNAGSNTATDHIEVVNAALAQLPHPWRSTDEHGRRAVLVRTDAAGATHTFTHHLAALGVEFSVGAYLHHFDIHTVVNQLPEQAWTPAYQVRPPRAGQHGPVIEPREGAWVAEATGLVDLTAWPAGTRLILRRERPHPGAQLRITDVNGHRIVGMLTNTPGGQLADLELRHRRHARVEDRIRNAKDTGMRNLPFHDLAQNRIWLAITALATDLLVFTQRLALTGPAASYEPKRLRLRILAVAGRLVRTRRRQLLHIDPAWPWADQITTAHARLAAFSAP